MNKIPVTQTEYNKIMDKFISSKLPVHTILIDMLEEAAKYTIIQTLPTKNENKKTKKGKTSKSKNC